MTFNRKTPSIYYFLFGTLLLTGIFIRLWGLHQYPSGLWFDEGINGLDGWDTILNGPQIFYYRSGNPREPLYIYWIALLFRIFPPTIYFLRFSSAVLNIFSIPVFYYLAKRFFIPSRAFLTVIFLVFFRWNLHFARLGFRTQIFSLLFLISILTLTLYIDKKRDTYLYLTAFIHGISFYTYLSSRFVPVFTILILIVLFRKSIKKMLSVLVKYSFIYIVTIFPLLFYFFNHPEFFMYRVEEVSLLATSQSPFIDLTGNFIRGLSAFLWRGDSVVQHNYNHFAIFFFPFNLFFLYGLFVIITRKQIKHCQLVIWFFMALLITTLSTNAPNILRMSFFAPLSILILCSGIFACLDLYLRHFPSHYQKFLTGILLFLFIFFNIFVYYRWATDDQTRAHFNYDIIALAKTTVHFSSRDEVWIPDVIYNHPSFQFYLLNIPDQFTQNIHDYPTKEIAHTSLSGYIFIFPDFRLNDYPYWSKRKVYARYPLIAVRGNVWGEIIHIQEDIVHE